MPGSVHYYQGRAYVRDTKKVFLPKSCEHCSRHAAYDIMTEINAVRRWEWLCVVCIGRYRDHEIIAGYRIEVIGGPGSGSYWDALRIVLDEATKATLEAHRPTPSDPVPAPRGLFGG